MEQYIDKSILVEEIRKYIKNAEVYLKYHHNRNDKLVHSFEQEKLVMCELLSFIDTLEVKEVDFETSFAASIDYFDEKNNYGQWSESDLRDFAKHFFELGLKTMKGGNYGSI